MIGAGNPEYVARAAFIGVARRDEEIVRQAIDIGKRRGADVFKVHVKTRKVVQLTQPQFTPNTGVAEWSSDFQTPEKGKTNLNYRVVNMQPCPLPGGRVELDSRIADVARRFQDGPVPRPANWGGYRLRPDSIEFWQGRPSRLHDRLLFTRADESSNWQIARLSP